MADRWIDNWDACSREVESWFDDPQLLAELGRRSALVMLGSHPDLDPQDVSVPLLLRRLLASDWLGAALPCCGERCEPRAWGPDH
ncbi:MAG: hypothetical protein R2761_17700 [Acidimicrobiales bacterium]